MELQQYDELTFENIKHIDENGVEFWYARDLQKTLEYTEWRNFLLVIDKAKIACDTAKNPIVEHFVDVNKSIPNGYNTTRDIKDFKLTRYACYLIVQNGDPRKEVIALGQTYFALKTRQQELQENFDNLTEEQKRLAIRDEIKHHIKSLSESAGNAGVKN
ncbi:DNA-damage-inducible protein D [Streptococcus pneumoniae]|nr:DNA-damage-inducible protein D [Streptococcus pneumoniae]